MQHVAIDLGGRESQVCIRSRGGEVLEERRVFTKALPGLLQGLPASRVILETSAEAFRVADAAIDSGHEVRVVPATLVRQLGVGARKLKTDLRDARALSEASCRIDLPSVHIPSAQSRLLKSQCGSRELLIAMRTMTVNSVRGWMRTQLFKIRSGCTASVPTRVREMAQTLGISLPMHVEMSLGTIEHLTGQIKLADKALCEFAKNDPVCRRLMTIPGVGPVTAVRFVAALDKVERFKTAHAVASYLGLTPGENSSSERKQMTGITKAGSSEVRRTLVQGAWTILRRFQNSPMGQWARRIAERRGRFIAVVALARKLSGIMFALWRDGAVYQEVRSAHPL